MEAHEICIHDLEFESFSVCETHHAFGRINAPNHWPRSVEEARAASASREHSSHGRQRASDTARLSHVSGRSAARSLDKDFPSVVGNAMCAESVHKINMKWVKVGNSSFNIESFFYYIM